MTPQEFKILFDQHFDSIRNYIYYRSGDADLSTDIVQDVFMRLWEKKLDFKKKENVGLLYKMANNEFVSLYRRKKLELNYSKTITFKLDKVSPEDEMQYKELQQMYEEALTKLTDQQRVVFLMSRKDGLKYHEIAERLGISVKAVEKRMKHALEYFKLNLIMK
ncbi:MAG: sigma-70 family RNA polymerase sigma factor [Prolixibacteraceae bacterium]